jgi:alkylation response protein AidB-like acyl-CoA dehydrogenase
MTTTTEAPATTSVLSDEMLERFRGRAAGYDQENRFFQEDFDELRDAGYLKMAVPTELGGLGMNIVEVAREQRRLASYAPADTVAVNMHLYWTGLCADLYRIGDSSMQWLLEEAAAGEVFAAGHSERGNDLPGLYSTTNATRADGGWTFDGHKNFGTMTPVWTRLGFHGFDTSDPAAPQVVHAFLARDSGGFRIEETWDALGMRATRSDDTILEGAFVPDERIARVLAAGGAGMDLFLLGMFGWGLTGFSNVYFAIGQRMLELTIDYVQQKKSMALASGAYAYHPEIQHNIAEMVMLRDSMEPLIDSVAAKYRDTVADAPNWTGPEAPMLASLLLGMKHTVTKNALRMADLAVETVGGLGVSRGGEIERLFRDARMGPIHPGNPALAHELIAKMALGIDLDQQPRWG